MNLPEINEASLKEAKAVLELFADGANEEKKMLLAPAIHLLEVLIATAPSTWNGVSF